MTSGVKLAEQPSLQGHGRCELGNGLCHYVLLQPTSISDFEEGCGTRKARVRATELQESLKGHRVELTGKGEAMRFYDSDTPGICHVWGLLAW